MLESVRGVVIGCVIFEDGQEQAHVDQSNDDLQMEVRGGLGVVREGVRERLRGGLGVVRGVRGVVIGCVIFEDGQEQAHVDESNDDLQMEVRGGLGGVREGVRERLRGGLGSVREC